MDSKTPKPKIKSLSFKYRNYDCYEYIKDLSNFSDYICDLIRMDMEHGLLRNRYNLPKPPQIEPGNNETVPKVEVKAEVVEPKPKEDKSIPKIELKEEPSSLDSAALDDYSDFF